MESRYRLRPEGACHKNRNRKQEEEEEEAGIVNIDANTIRDFDPPILSALLPSKLVTQSLKQPKMEEFRSSQNIPVTEKLILM